LGPAGSPQGMGACPLAAKLIPAGRCPGTAAFRRPPDQAPQVPGRSSPEQLNPPPQPVRVMPQTGLPCTATGKRSFPAAPARPGEFPVPPSQERGPAREGRSPLAVGSQLGPPSAPAPEERGSKHLPKDFASKAAWFGQVCGPRVSKGAAGTTKLPREPISKPGNWDRARANPSCLSFLLPLANRSPGFRWDLAMPEPDTRKNSHSWARFFTQAGGPRPHRDQLNGQSLFPQAGGGPNPGNKGPVPRGRRSRPHSPPRFIFRPTGPTVSGPPGRGGGGTEASGPFVCGPNGFYAPSSPEISKGLQAGGPVGRWMIPPRAHLETPGLKGPTLPAGKRQ